MGVEIKKSEVLDILAREGVLQECSVWGGQPSSIADIDSIAVDESMMAAFNIPGDAQIYEITQDTYAAMTPAERQALNDAGILLRYWESEPDENGVAVTSEVALYVLRWEKNGKVHYAALEGVLTPSERSRHAAYSAQQLHIIQDGTTAGGTTISAPTDNRPLAERLAVAPKAEMVIDDVTYEAILVVNPQNLQEYPANPVNWAYEIDDMIGLGYKAILENGQIYWIHQAE